MDQPLKSTFEERIRVLEQQLSEMREKNYFLENEIEDVRKAKEKFQMIADFTQDWEFWIDQKADFIWISPSCNDLTGYTSDEFFKNPTLFYELISQ